VLSVDQRIVGPIRGGESAIVGSSTPVSNRADSVSKRTRFEVFKRDGFRCLYCGRIPPEVTLEIDHVIARANGGTNDIINLVTSCSDCNSGKSDVLLSEIPKAHIQSLEDRQEKLDQIRAIAEQARRDVEVQEELFALISDHWITQKGDNPEEYCISGPLEPSVRRFLKLLPFREVLDAVDVTFRNLPTRSDYSQHKYFCGVCWKKIEDRKQKQSS
jgi:HNH endonuclease